MNYDIIVVGAGIAGLSVASRLARRARTILLEQETVLGYHASGRSVTLFNIGLGNETVQRLSRMSRDFFLRPQPGVDSRPLLEPQPTLYVARSTQLSEFEAKRDALASLVPSVRSLDTAAIRGMVPILRIGDGGIVQGFVDDQAGRIDGARLLEGFARQFRQEGGTLRKGARVITLNHHNQRWHARTDEGAVSAPVLVNAAGAWADHVARLAGIPGLGLSPLRRTVVAIDSPVGFDTTDWPFVRSVAEEFYFLTEAAGLLISPADETPAEPSDIQPEEYDVAMAVHRYESITNQTVGRIRSRWAGLRTFAPDRVPIVGFDSDAPGFFWLAGQGGYGLQTCPALSAIAGALLLGDSLPESVATWGIDTAELSPHRFNQEHG